MTPGALVMAVVAAVLAAAAALLFALPAGTETQTYRRRIAATMLGAAALILGVFAYALNRFA